MANKSFTFDVPIGVLNNLRSKTISKTMDGQSIYGDEVSTQSRSWVEQAFSEDVLEDTGPYKAIVLRVEVKPVPRVQTETFQHHLSPGSKKYVRGPRPMLIHLKCRIPELHAHLKAPRKGNTDDPNYPDHHLIEPHPTFTAISDSALMAKVKVGDVVIVDFADRKNFTEPIYVSPITAQKNQTVINVTAAAFDPNCARAGIGNNGANLGGGFGIAPHQGNLSMRLRARNSNAKAVMFGDSQMLGTMGNFLQKYVESLGYTVVGTSLDTSGTKIGSKPRIARSGAGVHNFILKKPKDPPGPLGAYWQFLENALKRGNPDLVVCVLGGNDAPYIKRTSRYLDLANKIRSVAPNCKFLWFGPPPATLTKSGSDSMLKHRPKRSAFANKLKSVLGGISGMTYIIPEQYMPNYFKGKNRDGLHVNAAGARELINNLKKQGATAPVTDAPQKKVAPERSSNEPDTSAEERGKQWASSELLAAARSIVSSEMGNFADRGSARQFLKEKASMLSDHWGSPSKNDAYDKIKNRDFISGFVAASKPGLSSVTWQPIRIAEWQIISNQKHGLSGTGRIHGTSAGPQYGPETFTHKIVGQGLSHKGVAGMNASIDKARIKWNQLRANMKHLSYKITAAQLVNMNEEPLQGPLALPPDPKCPKQMGQVAGTPPGSTPSIPEVPIPKGMNKTYVPIVEDAIYYATKITKPSKIDLNTWHQWMRIMCWVESMGVINAINKRGYTGLYQFGRTTWNGTRKFIKKKGWPDIGEYVKTLDAALNPYINSMAGGALLHMNLRGLGSLEAKGVHLYMAHQQGLSGLKSIYRKQKGTNKWEGNSLVHKQGPGDFRRAWANGCSSFKVNGKSLYSQVTPKKGAPTMTAAVAATKCLPSHFYAMWIRKWNFATKQVSKKRSKLVGGVSKSSKYASRMARPPGANQDAEIAKPKGWPP